MTTGALIMMIVVLVGYVAAFSFCTYLVMKNK